MIDPSGLKSITGGIFRANPVYEIVLLDRLPEVYRDAFEAEAEQDPELHGVLWPTSGQGLSPKTICHETALLLHSLRQPGPLPAYVRTRLGPDCNRTVAELVLDGVLELAMGPDAGFVSGPAAHALIHRDEAFALGQGRIAALSRDALRYGQGLRVEGSGELSSRLYAYNTVPITAAWREKLSTLETIEDFLGIRGDSATRRLLERHWVRLGEGEGNDGWLMWRPRHARPRGARADEIRRFKLYVSPRPEALPQA